MNVCIYIHTYISSYYVLVYKFHESYRPMYVQAHVRMHRCHQLDPTVVYV